MLATLADPGSAGARQLRAGDLAQARATYEATLGADPDRLAALNDLAVSYYVEGHLEAARRLLEEVVASGGPHEQQTALLNLGQLYALDGYADAAQAYLESARGIDPEGPEPLYAQALLADLRGDGAAARALVDEAVRLDPDGAARASFVYVHPEERQHLEALIAEASGDRAAAHALWRELAESRFASVVAAAGRRVALPEPAP
ncbi:MAG TPA: tetratricopeptide repeat protein [Anaeromyxobacteraceae bacterium]|nr:tetratricopeptide repeat protein [Anaeromyxobacteraceae bacterium]